MAPSPARAAALIRQEHSRAARRGSQVHRASDRPNRVQAPGLDVQNLEAALRECEPDEAAVSRKQGIVNGTAVGRESCQRPTTQIQKTELGASADDELCTAAAKQHFAGMKEERMAEGAFKL